MPGAGLALIAEADLTGRRRVHRRPREARKAVDYYEDLKPGDFVVHQVHGVGRYEGMVARAIGGVERDYLLLAYRGGDKLYVPTDQVGTIRRYTGGDSPSLSKMGGTEWQKTRSKVRSAVQEVAAELVILYRQRLAAPGFAFSPDTPWQHEIEDAFPYEETPDQLLGHHRGEGRHGAADADGPAHLRRRRVRQDRGRDARHVQGGAGRQAGGRARADDAAREPARPDVPGALLRLPGARRGAQPVPDRRRSSTRSSPTWRAARST